MKFPPWRTGVQLGLLLLVLYLFWWTLRTIHFNDIGRILQRLTPINLLLLILANLLVLITPALSIICAVTSSAAPPLCCYPLAQS